MRLGIHGDGIEYANVARNMADGLGSFWKPYHDDFGYLVFHEHPPFVFWFQSLFFRIFGNGPYLEAFYGFFIGLLILFCTGLFWQGFWQAQVMASLTSERGSGRPHWHLLERWISEMIVPFLIAGVLMLAFKVPFRKIQFNRPALFFLLTALAGSLPFLISTRQHGRYILHSYPFFVLCLAFVPKTLHFKSKLL